MKKCVAYYRVSTTKQGIKGLGMEAQRHSVQTFLASKDWQLAGTFEEVETGKRRDRPQLASAIELCRKQRATLVIAKLDRLSRNAAFTLALRDAGIDFVCCDMPEADRFTIGLFALLAEKERDLISERTKAGLAAAKRNGVKLGNPMKAAARSKAVATNKRKAAAFAARLCPVIAEIRAAGVDTLKGIAGCLNARGLRTAMGREWTRQAVAKVMARA